MPGLTFRIPDTELALEPFVDEERGFRGLVPAGWQSLAPANMVRANSATDPTYYVLAAEPGTAADMYARLAGQLGLDPAAEAVDEAELGSLTWSFYRIGDERLSDRPRAGRGRRQGLLCAPGLAGGRAPDAVRPSLFARRRGDGASIDGPCIYPRTRSGQSPDRSRPTAGRGPVRDRPEHFPDRFSPFFHGATYVKQYLTFVVSLSLILAGCRQATVAPTIGELASGMGSYDRAFARVMNKWEIPGGALAVIDEGQFLLARGYGLADVARNEPVLPESLFRIASLSKPITAVAVLKLVEEGRLSLDTPAFRLLDDLKPPAGTTIDPRIDDITIRHLLEHSAGWDASASFDPMFSSQRAAHGVDLPATADCTTIIRFMLGRPLDFDPGSRYAYSNLGYCVLGRVIERVSGQTYQEYVQSQILAPIGIERMVLGRSRLADRHPAEVRYYECGETSLAQSVFPDGPGTRALAVRRLLPGGDGRPRRLDRLGGRPGAFCLRPGSQPTPSAILRPETLDTMLARPAAPLWEGKSDYYALGWRVRPGHKGATWWHTGSHARQHGSPLSHVRRPGLGRPVQRQPRRLWRRVSRRAHRRDGQSDA